LLKVTQRYARYVNGTVISKATMNASVTDIIGLGVGIFLLVVNDDHASISHRYGDPQGCV